MPVNDLAINVKGDLYFTDTANKKIWLLPKGGTPRVVDEGIESPNGVLFSPDQTLLYVSDYVGQLSWVFQIQPDGSLAHKQRYFYVHMPDAATRSSSDGMAVDADGRVYIATALGVQVFDQIGKCHAIIPAPQRMALSNVEFGGAEHGRDVRDQRRQGLQAQDQGQGRAVVACRRSSLRRRDCKHGRSRSSCRIAGSLFDCCTCRRICCAERNKTLVCIANYCQPSVAYDIWRSQSLWEMVLPRCETRLILRRSFGLACGVVVEEEDR